MVNISVKRISIGTYLTGFVEEKKSISFPILNGIDIDTEDETNKSPIAVKRGFRSGLARAMILRADAALLGAGETEEGSIREKKDGFLVSVEPFLTSLGCVTAFSEYRLS